MKARYLGTYIFDYVGEQTILVEEDEKSLESYNLDEFMRTDNNSLFDGVASETNVSSLVLRFLDSETVKLWRVL